MRLATPVQCCSALLPGGSEVPEGARSSKGQKAIHKREAPRDGRGASRLPPMWLGVSSRHRDACRPLITGYRVTLQDMSSIVLTSVSGCTTPASPRRDIRGHTAPRPQVPRPRPGMILEHSVEGGRRSFASGTPAKYYLWSAHNSKPAAATVSADSSKSIPGRITEALPVDASCESTSSAFGNYLQGSVTYVKKYSLALPMHHASNRMVQGNVLPVTTRQNTTLTVRQIARAIK